MKRFILISMVSFFFGAHVSAQNNTALSSWKTYTNDKYGFSFQYPSEWTKYGKEANVIDKTGSIVAIRVDFIRRSTRTTILIEYHLAPHGDRLYQYAVSQYNSSKGWYEKGGKEIQVAGSKAVEAFTTINIDGRGNAINPPIRIILVNFLDKQKTGSIDLKFTTPLPHDDIEVAKFTKLLSTFKFSD